MSLQSIYVLESPINFHWHLTAERQVKGSTVPTLFAFPSVFPSVHGKGALPLPMAVARVAWLMAWGPQPLVSVTFCHTSGRDELAAYLWAAWLRWAGWRGRQGSCCRCAPQSAGSRPGRWGGSEAQHRVAPLAALMCCLSGKYKCMSLHWEIKETFVLASHVVFFKPFGAVFVDILVPADHRPFAVAPELSCPAWLGLLSPRGYVSSV